jgi:tetratricopeptide (TPR) repeat protein
MSSRLDPSKAKEASAELAEGMKQIQTSVFKWKPDYLAAEPCFQKAGRLFKLAGLMDSAVDAWRKAADAAVHLGNLKQAAMTLENASREMSVAKDEAGKRCAIKLMADCASLLSEAGEPVRAADLRLRGAKLAEGFDKDLAYTMVDQVISIFEGDDDKDVYAVDPLKKALTMQLSLGKHASAMRSFDKLYKIWSRLDQKHNLYKCILSRVVLLLAAADPIAAQHEFDKHFDLAGFTATEEAAAAEDLIGAYTEADIDAMKKVLAKNVFGYLEHAITNVARKLPDGMQTGSTVGSAHADESASKAVTIKASAPGEFRQLGSGTIDLSSASFSSQQGQSDEAETEDEKRARLKADKDFDARASLFSRPGGAAAVNVGSSGVVAAGGGGGGGQKRDDDPFATDGDEEHDIDAAFAALGSDGLPTSGNETGTDGGREKVADEDLGLL